MTRRQAYKFETMPNGEQARQMRRFFGCSRFVYNKALALNNARFSAKEKRLSWVDFANLLPEWKKEHVFLKDAPSQALQQALKDLEASYTNFFKMRASFPKFKKKGQKEAFRIPQGFKIDSTNGRVYLPKLGWVRYRKSQEVLGEARSVTVRENCGKWFVSIQTERDVPTPIHSSTSDVGIDLGIALFATLSNGNTSKMPETKKLEERKKLLQRRLKNKTKFSMNWKKQQVKIKKISHMIGNIRNNHRHQFTHTVSKNHAIVYGDNLAVKNMSKSAAGTMEKPGKNVKQKSGLNRLILAQGWGEVNRQLQYKAAWRGGLFIPCPPQFGSQRCSYCGHISRENRMSQELFLCVDCGFTANADYVAALNKVEAGRAFLACGEFPSWTRFAGFKKNSAKQEPTEAIQACA